METVAGLDVRVLITIGHGDDPASLGPRPANVHVERWVPQAAVFASAAAVVCHGGSGTTIGTRAAGLPMVVVPLFADQPSSAARVSAVGAGVVVAPPEPDELAAAIKRVVTEPSFGVAARAVAAEMRSQPPGRRDGRRAVRGGAAVRGRGGWAPTAPWSHFAGIWALGATSLNRAPRGSAAAARRPYGVSMAGSTTEPPSCSTLARAASASSAPK